MPATAPVWGGGGWLGTIGPEPAGAGMGVGGCFLNRCPLWLDQNMGESHMIVLAVDWAMERSSVGKRDERKEIDSMSLGIAINRTE